MAIPNVSVTVTDGGLGQIPPGLQGIHVKLGVSSLGTPNTIYSFSKPDDVVTQLGYGPLPQALCYSLGVAGGPVYAVPIAKTVNGTIGAITKTNVLSPTITAIAGSGGPNDAYRVQINVTLTGVLGTGRFQWATDVATLDGGSYTGTFSEDITLPTGGTYTIPNTNIDIIFPPGTYAQTTDSYTFKTVAPFYSTTSLSNAMTPLLADTQKNWLFAHLVGAASTAAASATFANALQTHMTAAATAKRFTFSIMEAADDTDANLVSAFASVATNRVEVCGGFAEVQSFIDTRQYKQNAGHVVTPLRNRLRISQDVGITNQGALTGVTQLYRDESVTQALDAARFTTLRTIPGFIGFFPTHGRIMSATGSDFIYDQYRTVMDAACRVAYQALALWLNQDLRTNSLTAEPPISPGSLLEQEAARIENNVIARLNDALRGEVTNVTFVVDRTNNFLSTSRLLGKVRVRPFGYAKFIELDIGFGD